jgi:predicted nicotinamide N-methyase
VVVGGRALSIRRPRDSEALLDEHAFEHEEYLPYWAELWPSGVALGRRIASRSLGGVRAIELGCGLAVPSIVAALGGARVLATDWAPDALGLVAENAARNGAVVETMLASWTAPAPLVRRGPFELVLGSDLLYEPRNVELLALLLPQLVARRGEVLIADPARPHAPRFLKRVRTSFTVESFPDRGRVAIHRLRPRGVR